MDDIVNIVDEHDTVIGTKSRSDLTNKDIVRVAILWIENSAGQVLLQQRSLNKKIGPGQWGPAVAGTVESHETPLTNIIKEAREETGLTDFTPQEVGKRLFWEPDSPFGRMFTFFCTTVDKNLDEFTIEPEEVAEIIWTDKATLLADVAKNPQNYVPSARFFQEIYAA